MRPWICSGDMKAGVPIIAFVAVRVVSPAGQAMPKSVSLTRPRASSEFHDAEHHQQNQHDLGPTECGHRAAFPSKDPSEE
nr:hypothetical protein [Actinocorallia herbida]